jgi:hypothetical protein
MQYDVDLYERYKNMDDVSVDNVDNLQENYINWLIVGYLYISIIDTPELAR